MLQQRCRQWHSTVNYIGGLVGYNGGTVTQCYSTGAVSGSGQVGGLVGGNSWSGTVTQCYSTGAVSGERDWSAGWWGRTGMAPVTHCYSTGAVSGDGLCRRAGGVQRWYCDPCYSTGAVSGNGPVSAGWWAWSGNEHGAP